MRPLSRRSALAAAAAVAGAGLGVALGMSGDRRVPGAPNPVRPTGPAGEWTVVFSDDFTSGAVPSAERWRRNRYGADTVDAPFNPDLEAAAYDPRCAAVVGDVLRLTVIHDPVVLHGRTYPLRSGTVSTEGTFLAQDGDFVEARVRVPAGVGLWPAFWSLVPDRWPPEIDCFEFHDTSVQDRPAFNYHRVGGEVSGPRRYGQDGVDHRGAWHVYGWHRSVGRVVPYLDGVPYPEAGADDVDELGHFLVLNLAVLDTTAALEIVGATMDVDWVRAWRPVM